MRHYGLKMGDTVVFNNKWKGEVIHLFSLDNNRVRLRLTDGTETDAVAEWCRVIVPCEPTGEQK